MRFLHTADWHIGRKLAGYELLADQQAIFDQLVKVAKDQQVDAIVVAGDLYDRALPNEAAVTMVNQMLLTLNREIGLPTLVISGNHDSAVRLGTGRDWFKSTDLFLNTQLDQAFAPVVLGNTQFFLLPYFEPFAARSYFDDDQLTNINLAMQPVIDKMVAAFDPTMKHVLVGHFFAAGSEHSDSETLVNVGGLDAVAVSDLAPFDYVALGHLHNRHALNADKIQYAGSLLKFSVSEAKQEKGAYIVDTDTMTREFVTLPPAHDVVHLTASFSELTDPAYYQALKRDDYIAVTLTDRQVIPNVMSQLREIYPQIVSLDRKNGVEVVQPLETVNADLDPMTLLGDFFEQSTGTGLTDQQRKWAQSTLAQAKEVD